MHMFFLTFAAAWLVLLAAGSSRAMAQDEQPCAPEKPPTFELYAPSGGVAGRSFEWTLSTTDAYRPYYGLSEHVSVYAADPARPIARPWSGDALANPEDTGKFYPAAGDGPIAITATWLERIDRSYRTGDYYYCSRSSTVSFVTIDAVRPAAAVARGRTELSIWHRNAPSVYPPYDDPRCYRYGLDKIEIAIRGPQRASVTLRDPCGAWRGRRSGQTNGPFLRLRTDTDGGLILKPTGRRTGVRAFRYEVRVGGRLEHKGRFWSRVRHDPGFNIYEGTDEFVNVCINGPYRIWSRNGRLYCHISGSWDRAMFYSRRPRQ